jgi:uncharacterized membrane protein YkgB
MSRAGLAAGAASTLILTIWLMQSHNVWTGVLAGLLAYITVLVTIAAANKKDPQ